MTGLRIAVISGGRNSEHDISRESAAAVTRALAAAGHHPEEFVIGRDGVWSSSPERPIGLTPATSLATALHRMSELDVAFPVLHGRLGEDGTIAALLELADLPYVGCGVRAGSIGMDKQATKAIAESFGLRVAHADVVLPRSAMPASEPPVVVKPTTAGSSHGVTLVESREAIPAAVEAAREVGGTVLVEELVRGREVHVAVLERADGTRVIPDPIEFVVTPGTVFDTSRKYDGSTSVRLPAEIDAATSDAIRGAASLMFDAIGCVGFARFDFFVTDDGFVLNEVNTTPGMTEHSGFPMMCAAAGIDYPALVDDLVRGALSRPADRA